MSLLNRIQGEGFQSLVVNNNDNNSNRTTAVNSKPMPST